MIFERVAILNHTGPNHVGVAKERGSTRSCVCLSRVTLLNRGALRLSGRPLFSLFFLRQMVPDNTSANRADHRVMTCIVTRDSADRGALQTARRGS